MYLGFLCLTLSGLGLTPLSEWLALVILLLLLLLLIAICVIQLRVAQYRAACPCRGCSGTQICDVGLRLRCFFHETVHQSEVQPTLVAEGSRAFVLLDVVELDVLGCLGDAGTHLVVPFPAGLLPYLVHNLEHRFELQKTCKWHAINGKFECRVHLAPLVLYMFPILYHTPHAVSSYGKSRLSTD